ncbi:ABC transporter permease [Bauldia litoralis]|uniref:Putative spermidine/putrescine transport system permease protein n=1 Tax=Bauldia litoralis TaxID=665467 RepID=A0A1G6EAX6_9HYPH|nr:ABC transporter permease [Bauldia litoralis]SDB54502.1 putative spermidine/putrescine transport system permease protein [Bauldia litoralis]
MSAEPIAAGTTAAPRRPRAVSLERAAVAALTVLWVVGVLLPILSLIVISVLQGRGLSFIWTVSFQPYADIFVDYRIETVLRTLRIVAVVTAIEFVLAFPFALWLAKGLREGWTKSILLVFLVVPFFLSPAARTIVWRPILGREGLINTALMSSGITDAPVDWLLFSEFAIHIGLIGPYFPSMVWPIFISVSLIDDELIKASRDLGATAAQTLRHVVLPLAMPGIAAGVIFTAIPMLGDNIASTLLGGGQVSLIAEGFDDLIRAMNFPAAAALGSTLLGVFILTAVLIGLALRRRGGGPDIFAGMKQ